MRMLTTTSLLLLLFLAPAALAGCHWECDISCVWTCDGPQPVYYEVLFSEPNWCIYDPGDVLYIHASLSPYYHHDAWYVIPSGDCSGSGQNWGCPPGPDSSFSFGWVVGGPVNGACGYFLLPSNVLRELPAFMRIAQLYETPRSGRG